VLLSWRKKCQASLMLHVVLPQVVIIQGNVMKQVAAHLATRFKVPQKYIATVNKIKPPKGKR
jgi:cation transporter-like permease